MPLLATSPAGPIAAVVPAAPGCTAAVGPVSGPVVAWALVTDVRVPGGARLDPVWVAGGRTWTPDQYRAATGSPAPVTITAR
jgi:hypothetical protein